LERHPEKKPRIISDNGPQFIARGFKEFIRLTGITHVRTSPNYPQFNGKLACWHGRLKREYVRPFQPLRWMTQSVGSHRKWTITTTCDAQRVGLRDAGRQADWPGKRDLRRTRPQAGGGRGASTHGETKFLRDCVSNFYALQPMLAWAEDRALLRSTPSADSGAKTGARVERHRSALESHVE
jgi:transposase InsO family protein